MNRLTRIVVVVLVASSCVGLQLSLWRLFSARSSARESASQHQECRMLAEQITALRQIPVQAATQRLTEHQIRADILRASELATLPIARISKPTSRRLAGSPYVEQSTAVETSRVNLERLVRFLKELTATTEEHDVASIRLTEPRVKRDDDEQELWSVDLAITSLIYVPE